MAAPNAKHTYTTVNKHTRHVQCLLVRSKLVCSNVLNCKLKYSKHRVAEKPRDVSC